MHDEFGRIPGVLRARVVLDIESRPREIHLVTDTRKPPQYFVRDVEAVALAYYDWSIDRRIVSVAQLEEADAREVAEATRASIQAPDPSAPRPSLSSIAIVRTGPVTEVAVDLAIGTATHRGSAQGPANASHFCRLVAEATMSALGELLDVPAQVLGAVVVPAGAQDVAVSVITVTIPRLGDQVLSGSALVRGDQADAVARSVLAALNRRLSG